MYFKEYLDKIKENEILSKGFSALLLKTLGLLMGFLLMFVGVRNFGVENWGIFALCLAILNIISIFSRLGIDLFLVKIVSANFGFRGLVKSNYFTSLRLVLISSFCFSILVYFFSEYFH